MNNGYTKLSSLIQSGAVTDSSIIAIFDAEGEFIAKGPWYTDKILDYCERWGRWHKGGTGRTVSFRLI
jgi:hypothetical protein